MEALESIPLKGPTAKVCLNTTEVGKVCLQMSKPGLPVVKCKLKATPGRLKTTVRAKIWHQPFIPPQKCKQLEYSDKISFSFVYAEFHWKLKNKLMFGNDEYKVSLQT